MSTDVSVRTNPAGEVYIGEQDALLTATPVITAWQPSGDKRQNQQGTFLEGTDLNAA